MTDLRKAAEMALEALEDVVKWYASRDANENLMPCHNQNPEIKLSMESVEALRQALAQEEQEPVAWINYNAATGEETINRDCHSELGSTPLYKTPPKREWVGLPESAFAAMTLQQISAMKYAELLLKEKNA